MRPIIGAEPTHQPGCRTHSGRRRPQRGHACRPAPSAKYPPAGEGHPTVHRPHRAARGSRPPGRARPEPALVAGTPRPRSCSRASTRRCGTRSAATRCSCSARSARSGSRRWPRTPTSSAGSARRRDDLQDYLDGRPLVPGRRSPRPPARRRRPAAIAYFSPEYGITAVLPQYSGGLGILAGDHLKAASDLGVPIVGVGLLYRVRLLRAVAVPRGLAAGALPGARPQRAADLAAARGRRQRAQGAGRPARRAARWSRRSGRRRSAGCRCCCSTPTSRTTSRPSARSPTASTAAAASTGCSRRCCSASAASARCAPTAGSPARPRRRCSTPTRATPASSASSASAS